MILQYSMRAETRAASPFATAPTAAVHHRCITRAAFGAICGKVGLEDSAQLSQVTQISRRIRLTGLLRKSPVLRGFSICAGSSAGRLTLDGEERPLPWDPLELGAAPLGKADSRASHEVLHGARDEDFPRFRVACHARPDPLRSWIETTPPNRPES